jgi:hypothetical protein
MEEYPTKATNKRRRVIRAKPPKRRTPVLRLLKDFIAFS